MILLVLYSLFLEGYGFGVGEFRWLSLMRFISENLAFGLNVGEHMQSEKWLAGGRVSFESERISADM